MSNNCQYKTPAYLPLEGGRIVFDPPKDYQKTLEIPCGKCRDCLVHKQSEWTTRLTDEARMHEESCVLLLTYNNENVPYNDQGYQTLKKADVTAFIKALRKKIKTKIRFFYCGEYGEGTRRPHYHVIIFGMGMPSDSKFLKCGKFNNQINHSQWLTDIWGKGQVNVNEMSSAQARYVSKYVTKDQERSNWEREYEKYTDEHGHKRRRLVRQWLNVGGEEIEIVRPFINMSRMPGIGIPFLKKWPEMFNHGYHRDENRNRVPIPKPYLRYAEDHMPDWAEKVDDIKQEREVYTATDEAYAEAQPERVIARSLADIGKAHMLMQGGFISPMYPKEFRGVSAMDLYNDMQRRK